MKVPLFIRVIRTIRGHFFRAQIAQIQGIISLMLVIEICEILDICG